MSHNKMATVTHIGSEVPDEIAFPLIRARIMGRVIKTASDCWLWQGSLDGWGYGETTFRGRRKRTHRIMYEITKGPIPSGLFALHTCDVPACCNPDHLWLGTQADNMADCAKKGRQKHSAARQSHCKRGHKFTPANTAVTRRGFRQCRVCHRIRLRLNAGWPRHLAETLPPTPHGYQPVKGKFPRRGKRRLGLTVSPALGESK